MAVVKLKAIWQMLDECAPGHTRSGNAEYWTIRFNDKIYYRLPTGKHGRRDNPEIEAGYVKNVVRHLGINPDCASRALPSVSFSN